MEDNFLALHFKSILLITGIPLKQFLNSTTLSPSNKVHYQCLVATSIKYSSGISKWSFFRFTCVWTWNQWILWKIL